MGDKIKASTGGGKGRKEDTCDHGCDHDLVQKVAEGKAPYDMCELSWRVEVMTPRKKEMWRHLLR